jgi:hypothetical protein
MWTPVLQGPAGAAGVAAAIEHSGEARTRLVVSWYVAYLGRNPANGEEQGWVNTLLKGAREEDVLTAILASDEFFIRASTLRNTGSAAERYLQALYSLLLDRTATPAETSAWTAALPVVGRPQVVSAFLHSGEFRGDMVLSYYTTLLHRIQTPAPAEVSTWVASGLDCTTIRVSFEASNEFILNG